MVQASYPGVYVDEVPSGARTITGVATSVTAFVGRARRGLVNEAVTITSYADFERIYGGLSRPDCGVPGAVGLEAHCGDRQSARRYVGPPALAHPGQGLLDGLLDSPLLPS